MSVSILETPKVSVSMITYNHEEFIAQAIESVLMQQCDFPFELVIGEDCSTDRTREIVLEYQSKYPGIIRLLLPENNLGMMRNFVQTMQACRGEYIALLEGDDYWTSPEKLQKQVNFLDSHPECVTCFHNVRVINESNNESYLYSRYVAKSVYALEDLLVQNPVPNCSTMFRNGLLDSFPEWYYGLKLGDWPLHIMNARYGQTMYLDEVLAEYRQHAGGVWSSQNSIYQCKSFIDMLEKINRFLGFQYHLIVAQSVSKVNFELFCAYASMHKTNEANKYLRKCWRTAIPFKPDNRKRFGFTALQLYCPSLYLSMQKLRRNCQVACRLF